MEDAADVPEVWEEPVEIVLEGASRMVEDPVIGIVEEVEELGREDWVVEDGIGVGPPEVDVEVAVDVAPFLGAKPKAPLV